VYGVPGLVHRDREPSPHAQSTVYGVAVTVAETPGRLAVADSGAKSAAGTHAHVGRFTTFATSAAGPGDDINLGRGSLSSASAVNAAWSADAAGAAPGTHINGDPAGT
jgi:hypothetical protein